MKVDRELKALYQGGLQFKIELQNDSLVKALATWLIESPQESRWQVYSSIVKPLAETGGLLILCERIPNPVWLDDLASTWHKASRRAGLSILHSLVSQLRSFSSLDWEAISRELVPLAEKRTWIVASGEALVVCSSCGHYLLSQWEYVRSVEACSVCGSDVFKFLPTAISPVVKESIMRGVLMEVATAAAVAKAGGFLFKMAAGNHGEHYVGLLFQHPVSPIEIDLIGDLGDVLLIAECKDPKGPAALAINEVELTASKVGRLTRSARVE